MKKYLLLFFFLPFISFAQQCDTVTNGVQNADSVVYCVDSVICNLDCDGRIEVYVYPSGNLYSYKWNSDSVAITGYNVRDSLCAGTYGVTIFDANGVYVYYQDFFD